jgi:two-component sensor histidine kinase
MLSLNKDLHELIDKFLHRIKDNLKIGKLTKKIESFYESDFKEFLAELKKQRISMSLIQQDEREPYFKEYKEKILMLK